MNPIAKQIIAVLKSARGSVATRFLMEKFGHDATTAALDFLSSARRIIRVRGQGGFVELA